MFHSVFFSLQEHVLKEETRTRAGQSPQQGESSGKKLKWRVGEEEARGKNQIRSWWPDAKLEFHLLHVPPMGCHHTGTTHHHTGMPPIYANAAASSGLPDIPSYPYWIHCMDLVADFQSLEFLGKKKKS